MSISGIRRGCQTLFPWYNEQGQSWAPQSSENATGDYSGYAAPLCGADEGAKLFGSERLNIGTTPHIGKDAAPLWGAEDSL